jgi:hypothetical protein
MEMGLGAVLTETSTNPILKSVENFYSSPSSLVSLTSKFACQNCYAAAVADFAYAFKSSPEAISNCSNMYSKACMGFPIIKDVLNRFSDCAGFTIDNNSPYLCSSSEETLIRSANIPKLMYIEVFGPGTGSMKNLRDRFSILLNQITGSERFRCSHCFENLLLAFQNTEHTTLCKGQDTVPECLNAMSDSLVQFKQCAGFIYNFEQPAPSQISVVPIVVDPTTLNKTTTTNNVTQVSDRTSSILHVDWILFSIFALLVD